MDRYTKQLLLLRLGEYHRREIIKEPEDQEICSKAMFLGDISPTCLSKHELNKHDNRLAKQ